MVVGHSLGGALANIASLDLAEVLNIQNIMMVSLGAPRVGNHIIAQQQHNMVSRCNILDDYRGYFYLLLI